MAETFADISFPRSRAATLSDVRKVVVRRREYQHEMLIVDVWKRRGDDLRLRSNAPVVATVKGPRSRPISFVGYVDAIHEIAERNDSTRHLQRIICVGPTYRMKEAKQRTWRDVTLGDIARKLCQEYRLSAVIENHPSRKTFHQAGETDWEFLCRVARTYGYVVYPLGTALHVHSRNYQVESKQRRAHLLTYQELPNGPSEVVSFAGKFTDSGKKAKRTLHGVDPLRGTAFSSSKDGTPKRGTRSESRAALFTRFPDVVALDAKEAKARVEGAQEVERWDYLAEAKIQGRADVAPTSVLYLDGLDNGYDGYWTVTGVDHVIEDRYHYYMHTHLGTDSVGTPKVAAKSGSRGLALPARVVASALQDAASPTWIAETIGSAKEITRTSVRRPRRIPLPTDRYSDTYTDEYA